MTQSVLTFGETMLRLSPHGNSRIAQADTLDTWVAGSESNVAAGLCALGGRATWLSRLPDNAVGRKIESSLRGRGVDVSHIVWTGPDDRVGLFYAEPGAPPRATTVIYDRRGSAASTMTPGDIADRLFDTHAHLHVSGITPALSASCAETVADAIQRAKAARLTVSFDVNYRAKLWTPQTAAQTLAPFVSQADVLFCCRADAALLFGIDGSDIDRASSLRDRFGVGTAVMTTGADGAVGCDDADRHSVPAIPVATEIGRFGSGDAFAAGFLWSYLGAGSLIDALRAGVAAAALKRTVPGDFLVTTPAEFTSVLAGAADTPWR